MNRADCKALRSAALELAKWLHAIDGMEFYGVEHRKYPRLIKRLRAIAAAEQAKLGMNATDLLLASDESHENSSNT